MANIMLVMGKSLVKGKFNPKALTGLERFMLAQDIHADAYAANAPQGVDVVKGWMGNQ